MPDVSLVNGVLLPRINPLHAVHALTSSAPSDEAVPSISILVAVRNEGSHLAETLSAVERAGGSAVEVLIIDGQSTDDTVEVAKRFSDRLPGWRVLKNPRVLSAAGWNIGLAEARAPVVMLLSGHARVPMGFFEVMLAALTPDRAGVGAKALPVGDDPRSQLIAQAFTSPMGNGGASFMGAKSAGPVESIAFGCYWREQLLAVGGFDESIVRGQDWDLNLRLRMAGHVLWYEPGLEIPYSTRSTFRALWRRQFLAGLWKDYIHRKNRKPFLLRHWVPAIFVLGMVGPLLLSMVWPSAALASLLGGTAHFAVANWQRRKIGLPWRNTLLFWWALWVIHVAYGLGFWGGIMQRARATSLTQTRAR